MKGVQESIYIQCIYIIERCSKEVKMAERFSVYEKRKIVFFYKKNVKYLHISKKSSNFARFL